MKKTVEFIILDNESQYRLEFIKVYCSGQKFILRGFNVNFLENDFDHIFSEPTEGENNARAFSKRRAKRLMFIKALLEEDTPREILFEPEYNSLVIISLDMESVLYLRPIRDTKTFQVKTFFDFGKDTTRMYKKQRNKCVEIDRIEKIFEK